MRSVREWVLVGLKKIDGFFSAIFGIFGGLLFAQFPQFVAQYLQRLGGHIDEARMVAKLFRLNELSLRADALSAGLSAIENAPFWAGIPQFITHAQWAVAREAWRHYKPGMTFAHDEVVYLITGAIVGVLIYGLLKGLVYGIWRIGRYTYKKCRSLRTPTETTGNISG